MPRYSKLHLIERTRNTCYAQPTAKLQKQQVSGHRRITCLNQLFRVRSTRLEIAEIHS